MAAADEQGITLLSEVLRAAAVMRGSVTRALEPEGLSTEEWLVLEALWEQDGLLQAALASRTMRDRASVWRSVEALERRGLIEKRAEASDRRRVGAWLTRAGRTCEGRIHERVWPTAGPLRELSAPEREAILRVAAAARSWRDDP